MKTSLIALLWLLPTLATAHAQPAPQSEKFGAPIALPAEQSGLKISIAPTFRHPDSPVIELHKGDPHINIVLQNVSDKPLSLYEEWNSWGAYNLSLEISAIDGKTLDKPLIISKGMMIWRGNIPSTEILDARGVAVREVRLHLPRQVFEPTVPLTNEDMMEIGPLYVGFPFPPSDNSRTLTLRAVFGNDNAKAFHDSKPVWTGVIASPLTQYRFFWNTK